MVSIQPIESEMKSDQSKPRTKWPKLIIGTSIVTFLLLASPSLRAQDSTTTGAGGTSGDPYTITCASDKAMVGVQAKYGYHITLGNYVNMVRPVCVKFDAGGDWLGDPIATSSFAGKDEGEYESKTCGRGEVVSGFGGFSGSYLDGLYIYCAQMGQYGHVSSSALLVQGQIGGIGGTYFGPVSCPSDKPAKGITGKAHDWIDRFALVCNYPSTPGPTVENITMASNTIVGGNTLHGNVSLNAIVQSGGIQVSISRQYDVADVNLLPPNPIASEPLIPTGSKTGPFVFQTNPVPRVVQVRLNPGPGSPTHFVTTTFSILPPSMSSFSVPAKASPGGSATGTLTLNGNAPSTGLSATLTSTITADVTVPPAVLIPPGSNTGTFPITVVSNNKSGCSVISASGLFAPAGGTSMKQAMIAIVAPAQPAFRLELSNNVGSSATGTVSYADIQKVPTTFTLVSSNPAMLTVSGSVSIPANSQSTTFPITLQSRPPSGMNCGTITVTDSKGQSNSLIFSITTSGMRVN